MPHNIQTQDEDKTMTRHPAPRFGPLAVGGYVAITNGVLTGGHGTLESISVESDTIGIRLGTGNLAIIPQANAEPAPRPYYDPARTRGADRCL